ncbi:MAG: hypothetical protein ACXVZ3_00055 [Gaiellaceae bacterium]
MWQDFYRVAEHRDEICVHRPFYPLRPGGTLRKHLLEGLGASAVDELLRVSDRGTASRKPACCLFWTLGGNQVGKAALAGWHDLVAPALRDPYLDVAQWPFDGKLGDLLGNGREIILAETYPAEFYGHLGITLKGSKRDQAVRAAQAGAFGAWLSEPDIGGRVRYTDEAQEDISAGFGSDRQGEDRFDAFVGALGMLNVVLGRRATGWPADPQLRAIEGWMLGR